MRLVDTVSVVTGAGGGIGAALVRQAVQAGGSVVATDLDEGRLNAEVAAVAQGHPGRVTALAGDAADAEHIAAVCARAETEFGAPVDVYFANAGTGRGSGLHADEADWMAAYDINVMAHVRAAQQLVPGWVERGRGYFVSTASAAGLLTQIGSPTYSVTKHAAVAFAEWLSVTYGDAGIAVSCLCPMGVRTAMLTAGSESTDAIDQAGAAAVTSAGSVLEPDDVAREVLEVMDREEFLILPHPEVGEFFRRKGSDYDRWLSGMRRYQASLS